MPLSVIPGEYRIIGASPDGDSIRFYPDDPTVWTTTGIQAKPNAQGGVQLRLDAIDALETHYTPPHAAHPWRQPVELGNGAAGALLDMLGFSNVTRDARNYVTAATPTATKGYLLTRLADVYGRAVALAYPGARSGTTGADGRAHVGLPELRRSVNYRLLKAGLVYPTFYSKLYVDFRDDLAATTVKARDAGKGVWQDDATLPGFTLKSEQQLQNDVVLLPKLFRRLAEYLTDADGSVDLAGFGTFLRAHGDDQLFTVPAGQATNLDTLVKVNGRNKITLMLPPEQIVFSEK